MLTCDGKSEQNAKENIRIFATKIHATIFINTLYKADL